MYFSAVFVHFHFGIQGESQVFEVVNFADHFVVRVGESSLGDRCVRSYEVFLEKVYDLHPKTLIEIAMVLSMNSGSFPSNSHVSATFSILLRFGESWNFEDYSDPLAIVLSKARISIVSPLHLASGCSASPSNARSKCKTSSPTLSNFLSKTRHALCAARQQS